MALVLVHTTQHPPLRALGLNFGLVLTQLCGL